MNTEPSVKFCVQINFLPCTLDGFWSETLGYGDTEAKESENGETEALKESVRRDQGGGSDEDVRRRAGVRDKMSERVG